METRSQRGKREAKPQNNVETPTKRRKTGAKPQNNVGGMQGNDYEVHLLTLFSLKALFSNDIKDFKIESNNGEYGKFDDIILTLTPVEGEVIKIAFQSKHMMETQQITRRQLESKKNKKYGIPRYIQSYQEIKDKQNCYFVIYTNNPIDPEKVNSQDSKYSIMEVTPNIFLNIFNFGKVFKLRSNKDGNQNEFFNQFYLFSEQGNEQDIENGIKNEFTQNFGSNDTANLLKLFRDLHKKRFTNQKLNKDTLICHLINSTILRHHSINLEQVQTSKTLCKYFYNAVKLFDATHISCETLDFLKQNLKLIDNVSKKKLLKWAKDHKFADKDCKNFQIDSHCRILYHIDNQPIVLNYSHESAKTINCVLKLCNKKKFHQVKFILAGSETDFMNLYKTDLELKCLNLFENLSSLKIKKKSVYDRLISQFSVELNGCKLKKLSNFISFNDLIANNITPDIIVNSLKTGVIQFGEESDDDLPPHYIPRQILGDVLNSKNIAEDKSTLFIISCGQQLDKIGDFFNEKNLITVNFDKIETKTDINTNTILTASETDLTEDEFNNKIEHKFRKTCYLEAIGENESFRGYFRYRKHERDNLKKNIVEENEVERYFQKSIEIVSANPGMGKTTLMKSIAKKCPSDSVCILIPLKDYYNFFKDKHSIEDLLKEYFNKKNISANFQAHLTSYIFHKFKVIFLFDGFDEIDQKCHNNVFTCVKEVRKKGDKHKVWISTRPNFSTKLHEQFDFNDLEIEELKENTQKEYIRNRLSESKQQSEIEEIITKIDENIIIERHWMLLGTPLLLHIIIEMVITNEGDISNINNVTDLFKNFFKGKFIHHANKDNREHRIFKEAEFEEKLETYEIPALMSCLEKNLFNSLPLCLNTGQLNRIKESGDGLGIIVNRPVDTDNPNFIFFHNTYAEYFAAKWLAANYTRIPIHDRLFLLEDKYENLKFMFDIFITEAHIARLCGDEKRSANCTEDEIVIIDKLNRSECHRICASGDKFPPFEFSDSDYIPRQILGDVLSFEDLAEDVNTLFIISCGQQLDRIQDFFKSKNLFPVDFDKIKNKTDINTNIMLKASETDITEDELNRKIEYKFQKTCYLEAALKNERFLGNFRCRKQKKNNLKKKIVEENEIQKYFQKSIEIVSAAPGMGKTTLMKSIAKKCLLEYFCILIPLKDYSNFFEKKHSIVELLKEYFNRENMSEESRSLLINYMLQKFKVIFLFDGFNEIDHRCHNYLFYWVELARQKGYKVWISTRPRCSKLLCIYFDVNDLEIVELNEKAQKKYILNKLSESKETSEIDKIITKIYENIIIKRHQTLLGTPLLLHMITEMVINNEEDLLNINNITDLFKYFFKGKWVHHIKKHGLSTFVEEYFKAKLDSYEIPALKLCLETNLFNKLNLYTNTEQVENLIKSGDGLGIIINVSGHTDNPNFSFFHKTYAEYFAAKWLAANYTQIRFKNRKFLLEDKYENLKFMFDIFMAEGCPAHIAVLCGDEKRLANCTEDEIVKIDKLNRSVWHIICQYGDNFPSTGISYSNGVYTVNRNVCHFQPKNSHQNLNKYLEKAEIPLLERDFLFDKTALDYATKRFSINIFDNICEIFKTLNIDFHELRCFSDNKYLIIYYSLKFGYLNLLKLNFIRNVLATQTLIYIEDVDYLEKRVNYIYITAKYGQLEVLKYLYTFAKTYDTFDDPPLRVAAENGHLNIVKELIERDADVNATDNDGCTPLHSAAFQGHIDIVKELIARNADITATNKYGWTPLSWAEENDHMDIVTELKRRLQNT